MTPLNELGATYRIPSKTKYNSVHKEECKSASAHKNQTINKAQSIEKKADISSFNGVHFQIEKWVEGKGKGCICFEYFLFLFSKKIKNLDENMFS